MGQVELDILVKYVEISKRLVQLQKDILSNTNIGLSEFKLLNVLGLDEYLNQSYLGEFCDIDKPTTSRLINKLVEQNLVERKTDNADRRKTYISLSPAGKKFLCEIRQKLIESYNKYFNPISSADKSVFLTLLNKSLNKEELCSD